MLHILDIIRKKRDGGTLTKDEIEYFVRGCTDGSIPVSYTHLDVYKRQHYSIGSKSLQLNFGVFQHTRGKRFHARKERY